MPRQQLTAEQKKARRKERRAARIAARAAGLLPPPKRRRARVPGPKLGRRDKRQARRNAALAAKLALRPREVIDRGPVTRIIVGPRGKFTPEQQVGLELDDCSPNYWDLVFEGEGYRDYDRTTTRALSESAVRMFVLRSPRATVTWLA